VRAQRSAEVGVLGTAGLVVVASSLVEVGVVVVAAAAAVLVDGVSGIAGRETAVHGKVGSSGIAVARVVAAPVGAASWAVVATAAVGAAVAVAVVVWRPGSFAAAVVVVGVVGVVAQA
jgi:hypothetical protein